jgi:salicylate hydroxylase
MTQGADGMHSNVRHLLYPQPQYEYTNMGFDPVPYMTINYLSHSSEIQHWIKDPHGVNMILGKSNSTILVPLSSTQTHISLTIPLSSLDISPAIAIAKLGSPKGIIRDILDDTSLSGARKFPLYSATRTIVGKGRCVLLGDAGHGMVPFCGAGASSALQDGYELGGIIIQYLGE